MLDIRFHGMDYGAIALAEAPPADPSRLWTIGSVTPDVVGEVLAASDLHVVASRPYPVARSALEAMAAGLVVLAIDAAPIREIIEPDRTGLIVPADDPDAALRQARAVLDDAAAHRPLGTAAARAISARYDREVTMPRLAEWFGALASPTPRTPP
jgi:glycosyltransferase involved in cell wall biosynthesis